MRFAVILLASSLYAGTTIVDTDIRDLSGRKITSGSIKVCPVASFAASTYTVTKDCVTISIVSGAISTNLVATDTATPSGQWYKATWTTTQTWTEAWLVPTSVTPLTISSLRVATPASPSAQVALGQLKQESATSGQVLAWSGTQYAPTTISRSTLGLGNVDNTSDVNKPVSAATQNALDLKAPLANPTFTGTVQIGTTLQVGAPADSVQKGIVYATPGTAYFASHGWNSTFSGTRDDVFAAYSYNLVPGTAGTKVDATKHYFNVALEADYNTGTAHLLEMNWNYKSADGNTDVRPIALAIDLSTHLANIGFQGAQFLLRENAGVVVAADFATATGSHQFTFYAGSSQSGDIWNVKNYGSTVTYLNLNQNGGFTYTGNPASGGNYEMKTPLVSTSNTTHKPSPTLRLTGSFWNGAAANAWNVGMAAVGVSGTNGAYLFRISSDYLSSLLDIRADSGAATLNGTLTVNSGGSATKIVCWKTDGKTLGYATMAAGDISACN